VVRFSLDSRGPRYCSCWDVHKDAVMLGSLTEIVIGCAIAVHKATGPGLLESVYKACLASEIRAQGVGAQSECRLPVYYRDAQLEIGFRADIIVEKKLLIEVKAVRTLTPLHNAQLITYLKLTGCPVGLLLNFNVPILRHGIRRLVHPSFRNCDVGASESERD
jgi:GxxExxY protein